MSKDAGWPLQLALYSTLTIALEPVKVFDFVPAEEPMEYVTIGDTVVTDDGDKIRTGQEHSALIHYYSQKEGRRTIKSLMGKVYDALHEQDIEIPGHGVVACRFDWQSSIDLGPDGKTMHGIARYKISTYPNT